MPAPDLSEVVLDSEIAEPFQILRPFGQFAAGGWEVLSTQVINTFGVVSIASAREIAMLPEGDRSNEVRAFWTTEPMYLTDGQRGQTSDVLVWQGTKYRILKQPQYDNRGYWKALATRLLGD
jgi:hypothetical protein